MLTTYSTLVMVHWQMVWSVMYKEMNRYIPQRGIERKRLLIERCIYLREFGDLDLLAGGMGVLRLVLVAFSVEVAVEEEEEEEGVEEVSG